MQTSVRNVEMVVLNAKATLSVPNVRENSIYSQVIVELHAPMGHSPTTRSAMVARNLAGHAHKQQTSVTVALMEVTTSMGSVWGNALRKHSMGTRPVGHAAMTAIPAQAEATSVLPAHKDCTSLTTSAMMYALEWSLKEYAGQSALLGSIS